MNETRITMMDRKCLYPNQNIFIISCLALSMGVLYIGVTFFYNIQQRFIFNLKNNDIKMINLRLSYEAKNVMLMEI